MDTTSLHQKSRRLQVEVKSIFLYHEDCAKLYTEYNQEWYQDYTFLKKACGYVEGEKCLDLAGNVDQKHEWVSSKNENTTYGHVNSETGTPDAGFSRHDIPPWVKRLYKNIVLLTHPDRLRNSLHRLRFEKLFRQSAEAFEAGRYEDLISIALGLGVTIELNDAQLVPILARILQSTKGELKKIENSIAWLWCENCEDSEVRYSLFLRAIAVEGLSPPDAARFKELLTVRETQK